MSRMDWAVTMESGLVVPVRMVPVICLRGEGEGERVEGKKASEREKKVRKEQCKTKS